jgi:AraC-like DNA-binding protein
VATERQRDQQRIVWDPDERDPGKTFPNVRNVHPIRLDLTIRFEDLLAKLPGDDMRVAEVSLALGVSDRFLRRCCDVQLGMSPLNYLKLRRLQLARCALRHAAADSLTVSAAAMRHGFRNPGRFAAEYRQLYGEAPSYTLRHGPHRLMPELAPRRRSGKRSVRPTT